MNVDRFDQHMRDAIDLTGRCPARPFATLIVDMATDAVAARGWNQAGTSPIWHGEMDAIRKLFDAGHPVDPRQLALVTTAEPCPMCMTAVLWSGFGCVVYGTSIPFLRRHGWRQVDIRATQIAQRGDLGPCDVVGGVLEDQCNALFEQGPDRAKLDAQ